MLPSPTGQGRQTVQVSKGRIDPNTPSPSKTHFPYDANTPASVLNEIGSPYKLKHSEPKDMPSRRKGEHAGDGRDTIVQSRASDRTLPSGRETLQGRATATELRKTEVPFGDSANDGDLPQPSATDSVMVPMELDFEKNPLLSGHENEDSELGSRSGIGSSVDSRVLDPLVNKRTSAESHAVAVTSLVQRQPTTSVFRMLKTINSVTRCDDKPHINAEGEDERPLDVRQGSGAAMDRFSMMITRMPYILTDGMFRGSAFQPKHFVTMSYNGHAPGNVMNDSIEQLIFKYLSRLPHFCGYRNKEPLKTLARRCQTRVVERGSVLLTLPYFYFVMYGKLRLLKFKAPPFNGNFDPATVGDDDPLEGEESVSTVGPGAGSMMESHSKTTMETVSRASELGMESQSFSIQDPSYASLSSMNSEIAEHEHGHDPKMRHAVSEAVQQERKRQHDQSVAAANLAKERRRIKRQVHAKNVYQHAFKDVVSTIHDIQNHGVPDMGIGPITDLATYWKAEQARDNGLEACSVCVNPSQANSPIRLRRMDGTLVDPMTSLGASAA